MAILAIVDMASAPRRGFFRDDDQTNQVTTRPALAANTAAVVIQPSAQCSRIRGQAGS
jgi:hypothetical protein